VCVVGRKEGRRNKIKEGISDGRNKNLTGT
jgi:hypothetical protein